MLFSIRRMHKETHQSDTDLCEQGLLRQDISRGFCMRRHTPSYARHNTSLPPARLICSPILILPHFRRLTKLNILPLSTASSRSPITLPLRARNKPAAMSSWWGAGNSELDQQIERATTSSLYVQDEFICLRFDADASVSAARTSPSISRSPTSSVRKQSSLKMLCVRSRSA